MPGGVICSDLKGPRQPVDRMGNRYMINFIDHHTNYCKIFLAKTKVQAAKYFEHFQPEFERRFSCKVQVLRTDGGSEYRLLDNYCASLEYDDRLVKPETKRVMARLRGCTERSLTWPNQ